MASIPRLETERLILREWRNDDFEWFARIAADAEVRRFIRGTQSRTDAWRTFAATIGHWYLRGHSFWAVARKADGALIGAAGVLRHETWPGLEAGWQLAKEHWGHGYATEAARVAQDWAFASQAVDTVISCIDPENAASQRVAERLGNVRGRKVTMTMAGETFSVELWEKTRAQWRAEGRKAPVVRDTTELKSMPRLETERLILREWRREDIAPAIGFMADEDVTRYTVGAPQSAIDAWRGLTTIVGHWYVRGYGFWAVERKSDGRFIGRVGLWDPEGWPGMEVGWTLGREFWGQGYATEAARASLDYGFRNFDVAKLISAIHVDNAPSQAVARRLGERKGARSEIVWGGKTFPVDTWEITRDEGTARRARASAR